MLWWHSVIGETLLPNGTHFITTCRCGVGNIWHRRKDWTLSTSWNEFFSFIEYCFSLCEIRLVVLSVLLLKDVGLGGFNPENGTGPFPRAWNERFLFFILLFFFMQDSASDTQYIATYRCRMGRVRPRRGYWTLSKILE